jgi:UDP-N-acetylmuramoyl-tripeptide--D-alanyl-D-alanine ligase
MSFWEPQNIARVLGGEWIAPLPDSAPPVHGAGIDTRTLKPGQVFFAFRGQRADGHAFLERAARAGSPLAVIDDAQAAGGPALEELAGAMGVLRVDDARAALISLAGARRESLDAGGPESTAVIAVTGSNGKTTTKRLIDAVLCTRFRGTASEKSFNNDIGVPLTILGVRPGDEYLICEVGTSGPGEIAALASIIRPDIAVITGIGRAHVQGLGSLEGIAAEKASLLRFLRPGGLAVLPEDCPALWEQLGKRPEGRGPAPGLRGEPPAGSGGPAREGGYDVVTFGRGESAGVRVSDIEAGFEGLRFVVNGRFPAELPLLGEHNALNAAAALAVAHRVGMPMEQACHALALARGVSMRLERSTVAGIEIINDAYNANPESMLAAIRTLEQVACREPRHDAATSHRQEEGRVVAVLGQMLELGGQSEPAHREIGSALAASGVDLAVLVGQAMRPAAEVLERAWGPDRVLWLPGVDGGGAARIAAMLHEGDTVLLKGSRAVGLERVARALEEGRGPKLGAWGSSQDKAVQDQAHPIANP